MVTAAACTIHCEPSAKMSGNIRGYAISGEQRSGSSFLCQVLTSTGVLGRPLEYFNAPGLARFQPHYPQDGEGQLREITGQGKTPNGVYGVKLFSADFDRMAPTGWTTHLPNLHFVWLTRRDLLSQAISVVRIAQTGQYASYARAEADPVYVRERIAREIHRLAYGQARWAAFFARCGLKPLHLTYEEVAAHPQSAADAVARLVGLETDATIDAAQIHTRVQRDAISEEWRARFVCEAGDLTFLDAPLLSATAPPQPRAALKTLLRSLLGRAP